MAKLTHTESGTSYEVPNNTSWSAADLAWLAGDQRYTDATGAEYVFMPDAQTIPLIGPIAFQLLFTSAELVACDAAKETDAQVRIFWKLLDDPRTDAVDRNIPSVQDAIRHLETAGCIGAGRADELINTPGL